jgi:chaperone modulatory protein CbpM
MSTPKGEAALPGEIVEESSTLTVEDLSRMFAVDERHVVEWVEEGVLTVIEVNATAWRFSGAALRRARIAMRLERDLGVNLPGVALALDLLEELEQFRRLHQGERA